MYRNGLPQLSGELFVTDSGLETDLIFHERFRAIGARHVQAIADAFTPHT